MLPHLANDPLLTKLIISGVGLCVLVLFTALVMVPAIGSYRGVWRRFAALFLSLYVLVAFTGVGVVAGVLVVWFWDRFGT